jgi:hypothetical protein
MKKIFQAAAFAALVALASAAAAAPKCDIARDKRHKIARSASVIKAFKRHHPCPATGRSAGSCPGYVIDHIKPLCNCGKDEVGNMQWQTAQDAKVKDRWERRVCRARA